MIQWNPGNVVNVLPGSAYMNGIRIHLRIHHSDAYQAGLDGRPLSDNPHDFGTPEHKQWTKDHIDGSTQRHARAGTYGTKAGLSTYTPAHDPAAEILGIEPDMALRGAPALEDPTSILDDPPLRFPGEPDPDPWSVAWGDLMSVHFQIDASGYFTAMQSAWDKLPATLLKTSYSFSGWSGLFGPAFVPDPVQPVDFTDVASLGATDPTGDPKDAEPVVADTLALIPTEDVTTERLYRTPRAVQPLGRVVGIPTTPTEHCRRGHGAMTGGRCRTCERSHR